MWLNMLEGLEEDPALDDQYFDWLEENCECHEHNTYHDPCDCDCMGFDDWLEMVLLEQQESNCDF